MEMPLQINGESPAKLNSPQKDITYGGECCDFQCKAKLQAQAAMIESLI